MNNRSFTLLWKTIFLWCCWSITSVYILSLSHQLSTTGIRISFILFLTSLVIWIFKKKINTRFPQGVWAVVALASVVVLFAQGFLSAPNTTDAMVYHLPRVIGWIQARSVFQTAIFTSHDYMAPFAEMLVTYFYLLLGNDRLAFLPQLLALIGIFGVCYDQIRRFSGSSLPHAMMALVCVATPIAVLESVSTQTDLIVAFFLCVSLEYALQFRELPRWRSILLCSLSAVAAVMTKQVAIVFVLPSALIILMHRDQWGRRVRMALIAGVCVFPIMAVGFISNYQLYGTFLGQRATDTQTVSFFNSSFTPPVIVQNVVRNTLIQVPLPGVAAYIDRVPGLNDSRTTWNGATFHVPTVPIPQEDIAPNPVQLGIIIIGGLILLRTGTMRERLVLSAGMVSYLLFALLFRWQPYNNRITMSLLFLLLPVTLSRLWTRYPRVASMLGLLTIFIGGIVIVSNTSKPFISYQPLGSLVSRYIPVGFVLPPSVFEQDRSHSYYLSRPYWREPYVGVGNDVAASRYTRVGIFSVDGYRYPLMVEISNVVPQATFMGEGIHGEIDIVTSDRRPDDTISPGCRVSVDRLHQACITFPK